MRWEGLFEDLEGQMAAEERRDLDSEVAERTRRERALVDLASRLTAGVGHDLGLVLEGGRAVTGELRDVGEGWLLLIVGGREVLVPLQALAAVTGLAERAERDRTARRFGLGYALRALARDRATVALGLIGGPGIVGTIDIVGADHLVIAEHREGEPRRRGNVLRTLTIPYTALRVVESRR